MLPPKHLQPQRAPPPPARSVCVITGQPARYRCPQNPRLQHLDALSPSLTLARSPQWLPSVLTHCSVRERWSSQSSQRAAFSCMPASARPASSSLSPRAPHVPPLCMTFGQSAACCVRACASGKREQERRGLPWCEIARHLQGSRDRDALCICGGVPGAARQGLRQPLPAGAPHEAAQDRRRYTAGSSHAGTFTPLSSFAPLSKACMSLVLRKVCSWGDALWVAWSVTSSCSPSVR